MAGYCDFADEEMSISENLGYPRAYADLCRDLNFRLYDHGPPFTYTPYTLHQNETLRTTELEERFPIRDPTTKPTTKPKIFLSLLWKKLNHLGNAGFDPDVIRVDPYGNVVYYYADPASPLAWEIDHWFPCSRGGLTVPNNLRIVQWQVCKKRHNKLEFLIPWWDLQLGVSVNQFLSIFASSNLDFRHRAFSFLFYDGETKELNDSQTVDSHNFPQHFIEMTKQIGLAPAAIVASRRETSDALSALKSLDHNSPLQLRQKFPAMAAKKGKSILKENENPELVANPFQAIIVARKKERKENSNVQAEIQKLNDEVSELKIKNEEEKLIIQDLELVLIKRRRRAEKCRQLAEAQSSYRSMLEKMIRDAMHQSIVYKEQVRLNQAANNALKARLEAQMAISDASEKELHTRYKQRGEIEKQIRPELEQVPCVDRVDKPVLYLPGIKPRTPLHKELREFLEEQRASETREHLEEVEEELQENSMTRKLPTVRIGEGRSYNLRFPVLRREEKEEDEREKEATGEGNVEKWLQFLLDNSMENEEPLNVNDNEASRSELGKVNKRDEIEERIEKSI